MTRPKKRRSPQEKKVLSYRKDRRNAYGENDKASRKAIPLNKRLAARALRRTAKQALGPTSDISASPGKPVHWNRSRKVPDRPLADHLDDAFDFGRGGLDQRRTDKHGLRAAAKRLLRRRR